MKARSHIFSFCVSPRGTGNYTILALVVVSPFWPVCSHCLVCCVCAGTLRQDSEYVFDLVRQSSKIVEGVGTVFDYHIGTVSVCKMTLCLILGLNLTNARICKYETMIREGCGCLPPYKSFHAATNDIQGVACQYIHAFIVIHAEKSPSSPIFWLDKQSVQEVYNTYKDHCNHKFCVAPSTFRKLWYRQLKTRVADPATGFLYEIKLRKRRACGFAKCNNCSELEFAVMMAKGKPKRTQARNKLHEHLKKVKGNRRGLQAARAECNGKTIVGCSVDAADYGKFPTPTTKATAKHLAGLYRIKNKITGVEFFHGDRKLLLFRTLPNITTGANLTLTLFTRFR